MEETTNIQVTEKQKEEALKLLKDTRRKKIQSTIDEKAEVAVRVMNDLVESSDVPPIVRLNAAKDVLDRAGFKPVEKQLIAVTLPKPILDLEAIALESKLPNQNG